MALVAYLDWEVRTTGHDLNCSGFNPARDATNGVDYTQQDNAEITSLNWVVDSTNNTWIRSTELTNWVNSGKTLASLKGNHIHIAGKAIGGNTLFQWNASTAVPGAYYLQALGGGNPNWATKPTRFWMNKTFVLENTSLPSGVNSWTFGDKDSLGYSTIYVRFGAESDANPNSKAQDDIIADGQTWTRGAYEIVNVGTDGNGPYLVLDRSPGAAGSTAGYGRIGGAMASPGGVASIGASNSGKIWCRVGTYYFNSVVQQYPGSPFCSPMIAIGYDLQNGRKRRPTTYPVFNLDGASGSPDQGDQLASNRFVFLELRKSTGGGITITYFNNLLYCRVISTSTSLLTVRGDAYASYCERVTLSDVQMYYCYLKQCHNTDRWNQVYCFSIIDSPTSNSGSCGIYYCGYMNNTVIYGAPYGIGDRGQTYNKYYDSIVLVNVGTGITGANQDKLCERIYMYGVTVPVKSGARVTFLDGSYHVLPGNPFRDPANGDFRLADNEAGRMLKQAGFQIPGPQGAPPMKFDAGAVQNSFYDIASGGRNFFMFGT